MEEQAKKEQAKKEQAEEQQAKEEQAKEEQAKKEQPTEKQPTKKEQKAKEQAESKFYDEALTEIFSNVRFLRSFLEDIIKEPWVEEIDFTSVSVEKSVFKGIGKNKRECDLLIQFRLKGNQKLFLYVLLELQSSDELMLLRLLEYLHRAYSELKKEFRVGKVPVIIPIVLYNGDEPWTSKQKFSEMLEIPIEELQKYIPDFEFIMVDVGSIPDKTLKELKSEIGYLFLLDKTDLTERQKAIDRICQILDEIFEDTEIFDLLSRYITALFEYKDVPAKEIVQFIKNREKEKGMLAQSLDKIEEKGIGIGEKRGEERGIGIGERKNMEKFLTLKFGILSEKNREYLYHQAVQEELDLIRERILAFNSIEQVFDGLGEKK